MKRKTSALTKYPGIYQVLTKQGSTWLPPKRGKAYGVKYTAHTVAGKKVRRQHFDTLDEAKNFWAQTRIGITLKENPAVNFTFLQLCEDWKKYELPTKAIQTQAKYLSYLRYFEPLNPLQVERINVHTIDELIALWRSPKCRSSHRENYSHEFSLLKSIFNYYIERHNRNYKAPFVTSHRKAIIVTKVIKPKKDLTAEELCRFFTELKQITCIAKVEVYYYLAVTQLAIFGRIQEAAALHFEDFDFEKQTVTLQRRLIWMRQKGYDDFFTDALKAGSIKVVPIDKGFIAQIKEWMLKSGKKQGLMFSLDNAPLKYRGIEHYYNKALKTAGLPFRATHLIRHAAIMNCYAQTKDILVVKALAGHSDIKTTAKYATARSDDIRNGVMELNKMYSANNIFGTQTDANPNQKISELK